MTLRIRPKAHLDLEDIAVIIGTHRPESARLFLSSAARMFELLSRSPHLGAGGMVDAHPDWRLLSIRRFPNYVIVYSPQTDGVEILRVVDGRRDLAALLS